MKARFIVSVLIVVMTVLSCAERPPDAELAKQAMGFLEKMPPDEVVYMKIIGSKEPADLSPLDAASLEVAIEELKVMAEQLIQADPKDEFQPFTFPMLNTYTMPAAVRVYQMGSYKRFMTKYAYPRTDVDYIEYKNHLEELRKDEKFRKSVREKVLSEDQQDEYERLFKFMRQVDGERAYLKTLNK